MTPGGGFVVFGRVSLPDGKPARRVPVYIETGTGLKRDTLTNEEGNYEFRGLTSGRFRVWATNPDVPEQYTDPAQSDASRSYNNRLQIDVFLRLPLHKDKDAKPGTIIMDEDLFRFATVFPAGGTPHAMFEIATEELGRLSGARVGAVAVHGAVQARRGAQAFPSGLRDQSGPAESRFGRVSCLAGLRAGRPSRPAASGKDCPLFFPQDRLIPSQCACHFSGRRARF